MYCRTIVDQYQPMGSGREAHDPWSYGCYGPMECVGSNHVRRMPPRMTAHILHVVAHGPWAMGYDYGLILTANAIGCHPFNFL